MTYCRSGIIGELNILQFPQIMQLATIVWENSLLDILK